MSYDPQCILFQTFNPEFPCGKPNARFRKSSSPEATKHTLQGMVLYMTFFGDVLRNRHEIILSMMVIVKEIQL
jgi:hypothetical protein